MSITKDCEDKNNNNNNICNIVKRYVKVVHIYFLITKNYKE